MVTEYHLNLGPSDNLERLVNHINNVTNFKPSEKKEVLIDYLRTTNDKEVNIKRQDLKKNVPYRLQAPFMKGTNTEFWKGSQEILAERINSQEHLMYYFESLGVGMKNMSIRIQPEWAEYIKENAEIILGWLNYNLIMYLQRRNPSVPGIADKLEPPKERKLEHVKKYWKLLLEIHPTNEIYNGSMLDGNNISIDHFVPWSYVASDEFWNLHPTTKNINSAKSNNLPDWDKYFISFARLEYMSYQEIWKNDKLHKQFDLCAKYHLNSEEVRRRIYRPGLSEIEFCNGLEDTIKPVYNAAENCGFRSWIYEN